MIAGLPKLFNMIHFLFQSINRSVITKEELMHKILASHSDITERSKPQSYQIQHYINFIILSKRDPLY